MKDSTAVSFKNTDKIEMFKRSLKYVFNPFVSLSLFSLEEPL
jgi:hypothetical protein